MFTVNKNERGQREPVFVNGQLGTVEEIGEECIYVKVLADGHRGIVPVEQFTWR